MRICFVDNLLLAQAADGYQVELQPHLGLISLIAVARAGGHEALLYDPKLELFQGKLRLGPDLYATAAERILATEPDVVGLTALGCNFACTMRIAEEVRGRRAGIPILLGGPHASILDREILARYMQFDVVVRGEAELTLLGVTAALSGEAPLSSCAGITYREHGRLRRTEDAPLILDLDSLPDAAYDAYPVAEMELSWLNVDAGRGCPFHCSFCSTASFFGRRYRLKSAKRLVSDLNRLHETYGIKDFGLNHDLFTVNKVKIREFCAEIAPRGYTWGCSARIDCVDERLLEEMRAAGCTSIYYGIETGSQRLQKVVSKNLDLRLYDPIVSTSLNLGIKTTASFITGYPNETPQDQAETLALIGRSIDTYSEDLLIQLHLLTPEPGTALLTEFAAILSYDAHVSDFNFPQLDERDSEAVAADDAAFVCQRYYAAGCDRRTNIAITEGFRLLNGLGHVLLRVMKSSYGDAFGNMLQECGLLARRSGAPFEESIVAFVAEHWGSGHPLYDICKYIAALTRLRPDNEKRISSFDMETPMRLARCISPIGYTRNGYELGRQLHNGATLQNSDRYSWHIIVADRDLSAHAVLAVDEITYELLNALSHPTTGTRLSAQFERASVPDRLWPLGLLGALVSCEASMGQTNATTSITPLWQTNALSAVWS